MNIKSALNAVLVGLLRSTPSRVMRRILFQLRQNPTIADRAGYHVRPIHYHEPLPDFAKIKRENIERRCDPLAIAFDIGAQAERVKLLAAKYGQELAALAADGETNGFDFANRWFAGLDAILYYCLVRDRKPKTIVEIGCGYSTRIAAKAIAKNRSEGNPCRLICIEPYPEPRLLEAKLDIELVEKRVEEVPVSFFSILGQNDILFIDSSHVVAHDSDVSYEFLSVLPTLNRDVIIHVHDIFWPTEYPAEWLIEKRIAFNEQYLLQAFLMFNAAFLPLFCARWLLLDQGVAIATCLPRGVLDAPTLSGSFWMRRIV